MIGFDGHRHGKPTLHLWEPPTLHLWEPPGGSVSDYTVTLPMLPPAGTVALVCRTSEEEGRFVPGEKQHGAAAAWRRDSGRLR